MLKAMTPERQSLQSAKPKIGWPLQTRIWQMSQHNSRGDHGEPGRQRQNGPGCIEHPGTANKMKHTDL
jgi:hypothetical protein